MKKLPNEEIRTKLIERGVMHWKLKPEQYKMYEKIMNTDNALFVINCSRRLGKSFLLCLLCDEYARQNSQSNIKYAAPSKKQVREIIRPIFNKLTRDCPMHLKPKWHTVDSAFVYPNGSRISLVGCDLNNIDSLRGEEMHFGVIDEAGMINEDLRYIIRDVLRPQTLTIKKDIELREKLPISNKSYRKAHPLDGMIVMASTPPKSPAHRFVEYITECESSSDNNYVHMTIYENSQIDNKTIIEYARESGCVVKGNEITRKTTTFRREYLAEVVTEETFAICPEFNQDTEEKIVKISPRPPYYDAYVGLDSALIDLTACLFGYWDFVRGKLIIENEVVMNYKDGMNTEMLAREIKSTELFCWSGKKPYMRVMDPDPILSQDLSTIHGLHFTATQKDDKEAAVNAMRLMVHGEKIEIHPRCKTLIAHLKYGIWNKTKRKFDRSGEFGHFDAVDALVYIVRNLVRGRNPYPKNLPSYVDHHINPDIIKKLDKTEEVFKNMLNSPLKKVLVQKSRGKK